MCGIAPTGGMRAARALTASLAASVNAGVVSRAMIPYTPSRRRTAVLQPLAVLTFALSGDREPVAERKRKGKQDTSARDKESRLPQTGG